MYVVWSLLVGLESLGRACHVRSLVVRDAFLDGADFVSELFDDWFVGWVVFLQQILKFNLIPKIDQIHPDFGYLAPTSCQF